MKNPPHPIQYQGSKRGLAPVILRYAPPGIDRLLEPFAGSAAITIAAATRGLARGYVVNDLNKPLADLLRLIVDQPHELASCYERLWHEQHNDSVGHYFHVREHFNRTQDPRLFLYLLARCVKGAVRYNADGRFNQSPDKRRKGTQPATMRDNILGVSRLLKGKTVCSALDYQQVLAQAQPDDLVYMDPPYQGVCGERDSRYVSGVAFSDFVAALEELNARCISFMVSYDGRRGSKTFGEFLPPSLELTRVEIEAGRSSQATLLGRQEITYESLYLSAPLIDKLSRRPADYHRPGSRQLNLLEPTVHYAKIPQGIC